MRNAVSGLIGATALLCGLACPGASPLIINGLPAGPHKVRIELVNANHQTLDQGVVHFVVP